MKGNRKRRGWQIEKEICHVESPQTSSLIISMGFHCIRCILIDFIANYTKWTWTFLYNQLQPVLHFFSVVFLIALHLLSYMLESIFFWYLKYTRRILYEQEPPKMEFIYTKVCIHSYMLKLQLPSKYSPFDAIHISRCFFYCSKQFFNSLIFMPSRVCAIFCFTSSTVAKCFSLQTFFIWGKA